MSRPEKTGDRRARKKKVGSSLNASQQGLFEVVTELYPGWSEKEVVDFCAEREWKREDVEEALVSRMEMNIKQDSEQWQEVPTKKQKEEEKARRGARTAGRGGRGEERDARNRRQIENSKANSENVFRGNRARGGGVDKSGKSRGITKPEESKPTTVATPAVDTAPVTTPPVSSGPAPVIVRSNPMAGRPSYAASLGRATKKPVISAPVAAPVAEAAPTPTTTPSTVTTAAFTTTTTSSAKQATAEDATTAPAPSKAERGLRHGKKSAWTKNQPNNAIAEANTQNAASLTEAVPESSVEVAPTTEKAANAEVEAPTEAIESSSAPQAVAETSTGVAFGTANAPRTLVNDLLSGSQGVILPQGIDAGASALGVMFGAFGMSSPKKAPVDAAPSTPTPSAVTNASIAPAAVPSSTSMDSLQGAYDAASVMAASVLSSSPENTPDTKSNTQVDPQAPSSQNNMEAYQQQDQQQDQQLQPRQESEQQPVYVAYNAQHQVNGYYNDPQAYSQFNIPNQQAAAYADWQDANGRKSNGPQQRNARNNTNNTNQRKKPNENGAKKVAPNGQQMNLQQPQPLGQQQYNPYAPYQQGKFNHLPHFNQPGNFPQGGQERGSGYNKQSFNKQHQQIQQQNHHHQQQQQQQGIHQHGQQPAFPMDGHVAYGPSGYVYPAYPMTGGYYQPSQFGPPGFGARPGVAPHGYYAPGGAHPGYGHHPGYSDYGGEYGEFARYGYGNGATPAPTSGNNASGSSDHSNNSQSNSPSTTTSTTTSATKGSQEEHSMQDRSGLTTGTYERANSWQGKESRSPNPSSASPSTGNAPNGHAHMHPFAQAAQVQQQPPYQSFPVHHSHHSHHHSQLSQHSQHTQHMGMHGMNNYHHGRADRNYVDGPMLR